MIEFIEYGCGVIEIEVTPDTPGWMRRTFKATQASGKPLTDDQWRDVAKAFARDLRNQGVEIHSVSFITKDE